MSDLPERTRVYKCHHFDSTRWDYCELRDDDIIIATSYKAAGLTGSYYEAGYMYVLYWFLIQALVFFFLSIQGLWARPS